MESIRLAEFYRNVTTWPRTRSELATIAERIAKLIEVPFVGIYLFDDEERIAYRFSNNGSNGQSAGVASSADPIDAGLFEELLKSQFKRMEDSRVSGGDAPVKQVQISRENSQIARFLPVAHLTFANVPKTPYTPDTRASTGGKRRKEPGWVIVGSSKALGPREQVLLLAAMQKLSELFTIQKMEAAIQLRNQFLSIASHELKTPLTSIYGILQLQERMMRAKPEQPDPTGQEEKKKTYLKMVIRQVERLNELIDGLLDVSRIQVGRFIVEPSEVDVAQVVRETLAARLQMISQEANVTIHSEIPEKLVTWIDPVRMEEVVTNLVMNAIRFSPEGGVVWVKLLPEGGAFRLTVRDQGPSVPVEDRERIFQPFERAQRTSRFGGLGLGLFISRQIAQLHGGNVSLVESVPGKGNVFEAYFPEASGQITSQSTSMPA